MVIPQDVRAFDQVIGKITFPYKPGSASRKFFLFDY